MKLTIINKTIEPKEVSCGLFLIGGPGCIYLKAKDQNGDEWFVLAINEDGTFTRCSGLMIPEFVKDRNFKITEKQDDLL